MHVRRVYGSIIAFEFGKPKLEVLKKVFYPNKKTIRKYPRRTATVRGEFSQFTAVIGKFDRAVKNWRLEITGR